MFDNKERKKCKYWSFPDGIFKLRTMNIAVGTFFSNYLNFSPFTFPSSENNTEKNEKRLQCNLRQRQVKIENNYLFKLIKNMETSLKTGFASRGEPSKRAYETFFPRRLQNLAEPLHLPKLKN